MNNKVRKQIERHIASLEQIKSSLQDILNEEQDKMDNMPEGLQESEMADIMQEAIDNLDMAIGSGEEAVDYLEDAKQ